MLNVELLPLLPLIAACFVSLVPSFDLKTRAHLSFILNFFWLGLIVFLGYYNFLDRIYLFLLLVQTIILFGIQFQPLFWMVTSLSIAAILSNSLSVLLIFAFLHIAFLLLIILQTGGLYKGSSSYESILFFLTVDLSAFFALSLPPYPWVYWILILPGLARILFPLTAPYAKSLFINCPTKTMLLILGGSVPIGIIWLLKLTAVCPKSQLLESICFGSSLFAIILFLTEKSRRQKAIYLFMSQSSLCANLILSSDSEKHHFYGALLCLAALINSAIWIYFLDFPKIRFLNISFAAITLFLLVYQP